MRPEVPLRLVAEEVQGRFDWNSNGFTPRPGDPEPEALQFLMALGLRTGWPFALRAALRSISALGKSPAYDSVDAGFFRSSGPDNGAAPDTAKPLALNARVLHLLGLSYAWSGGEDQRRGALELAAFIERSLSVPDSHLWSSHLEADEEYYSKMAHRRAIHGAPAPSKEPSVGGSAIAISGFAVAGAALSEPKLLARARIAFEELLESEPAGEGAKGASAEIAAAGFDLYCCTADPSVLDSTKELVEAVRREFDGAKPSRSIAECGRAAVVFARQAALDGKVLPAGQALALIRGGTSGIVGAGVECAPFGLACLAEQHGVLEVEAGGQRLDRPGGEFGRAAIALASALGPAVLRKRSEPSEAVAFFLRGSSSGAVLDRGALKPKLAAVVPLHEAV